MFPAEGEEKECSKKGGKLPSGNKKKEIPAYPGRKEKVYEWEQEKVKASEKWGRRKKFSFDLKKKLR